MLYNLLIHMWLVLNFLTTVFCLYHLSICLAAFIKQKKSPDQDVPLHRFAAVIAARNEENVIRNLIDSIRLNDYPQELIDIVVIADNCDDDTAKVAEEAGAIVYKRFNKAEVGKGYAVQFALEKIEHDRDVYDAYCLLDADNLVDREFFSQMNQSLGRGALISQGYRDIKNATDNWISGCHSIFYWMENRFFNTARHFMGLSATLNGTAIMISREYVRRYGYKVTSVTEDIELTINCVMNGQKVDWVPFAKVYDEQPLSIQQSMRQRQRWTNGFLQCAVKYIKPLAKSFAEHPTWVKFDVLMFLSSLFAMVIGVGATVLYAILGMLFIIDPVSTAFNSILLAAGSLVLFWMIGLLSVVLEGKNLKSMAIAVLTYPLFNLMWAMLYAKCIFKRNFEWKPIVHARNISINEVDQGK